MIATVMPPPGEPIPGLRPHLVMKLKSGWRFDADANAFVDARGRRCAQTDQLPTGTTLQPVSPTLQRKRAARLTAAERDLVRYFQIVLPAGADPRVHLDAVSGWPCAAEVRLPPIVSLPQGA
jgi:hypothetical protein